VPYRDPEKQRAYKREWKRLQIAGGGTPGGTVIPFPFKIRNAQDILSLLAKHVEAVEDAEEAGTPAHASRQPSGERQPQRSCPSCGPAVRRGPRPGSTARRPTGL